jgi:hypothetical protein
VRDTLTATLSVLIILWLAPFWKIIAAVFFSLAVGLAVTVAIGSPRSAPSI